MPSDISDVGPAQRYQEALKSQKFTDDDGQKEAVARLQQLFEMLHISGLISQKTGTFPALVRKLFTAKTALPKGLYLYGGVGRGKTMLMDLFYSCLEKGAGQRFHFHDFMVKAHHYINSARQSQAADPIAQAADQLIADGQVICFDEMEVRDIADAMIIKRLFECLWQRNMVLVATSNRHPEALYLNGLHRDRFVPFITNLKTYSDIHQIKDGQDWRQQFLQNLSTWHLTSETETPAKLNHIFSQLSGFSAPQEETIEIAGRIIEIKNCAGDMADVDFNELCAIPLAAPDYLAIANRFAGLIIRNIPQLTDSLQNEARRFMWLVDALYDRGRFLIVSADTSIDDIYCGHQWEFEFDRTASRLRQMARSPAQHRQNII